MFGLSPYLLGGTALAIALAFGGGYWKGSSATANSYQVKIDKLQLDAVAQLQKTREAWQQQADEAAKSLEKDRGQTRTVYRTITQQVDKIVDRPVYRNVCLDADGLRLANAALGGLAVEAPAPSQPRNLVPAVGASR
jgi:hypothetical protein